MVAHLDCGMIFHQVVDAMRQTVTNMIGTLPPQFFAVTVTSVSIHAVHL